GSVLGLRLRLYNCKHQPVSLDACVCCVCQLYANGCDIFPPPALFLCRLCVCTACFSSPSAVMHHNTIQHNTTQYNTIQYNTADHFDASFTLQCTSLDARAPRRWRTPLFCPMQLCQSTRACAPVRCLPLSPRRRTPPGPRAHFHQSE